MTPLNIRSVLLAAVLCNWMTWTASKRIHTRNVTVHRSRYERQDAGLYPAASYLLPGGEGSGWGEWGDVSPCSRTCGGGVASQKRICLQTGPDGQPQCSGGGTKYFSCETQDCPAGSKDYREQQCSEFDDVAFRNIKYKWVPYTKVANPCELNCKPSGERFYHRYRTNVVDGTRCNVESFDVCVNGTCESVGCDMMLGSTAREDKCRECRGSGANCHTTSGTLDTQDLVKGYNDMLLIPEGATNIVITEISPSQNYLALRSQNGTYYLNGDYQIDFPRSLIVAGALWTYDRSRQGFFAPDKLRCLGPTNEPLYLALLLRDVNVGIEYEYSVPKQYDWVLEDFTPYSASCGGDFQSIKVTCRSREEKELVDESLCDTENRPSPPHMICNTDKCHGNCSNSSSVATTGTLDTQNLKKGYNDMLLIPQGATNIVITEISPSHNYLALRATNGTYCLNGAYKIYFPGNIIIAGALWTYERSRQGFATPDKLRCLGPTNEPLYLALLLVDVNVGIEYEYSVPKQYDWVLEDFTPCSSSCGGGFQTSKVTCRSREEMELVDKSLCDTENRPSPPHMICNTDKCHGYGPNSSSVATTGILDTQDLVKGYNDMLLIPEGAINIVITEISPSHNYLALRATNGTYYLNGAYQIYFPGNIIIAGALWTYERSRQGFATPDKLRCLGPTNERLYLALLLVDVNVGIEYEYSVPKQYDWVLEYFTPCSASCGGGFQTSKVTCRSREEKELVNESLCDTENRPSPTHMICNTDMCHGNDSNSSSVATTGTLDTQDLMIGYNDVLLIPEGATNIVITEISPSHNYLALRATNGTYYLNGAYQIYFPGNIIIAGALWTYERSRQGFATPDKLRCLGPTNERLYLALLLVDVNVGIEYEYSVPKQYDWVLEYFTPCSASCGGGFQTSKVTCRSREEKELVNESLCDTENRPSPTHMICNTDMCHGNDSNSSSVATTGTLDTQDLMIGYNDVLLIPEGATNIVITEISPSHNYLALRAQNGTYYLNGDYHIDFPRSLIIAGALWIYERSQQGYATRDKLRCLGPTNDPLYLALLLQDENVGIEYEYSVPKELAPPQHKQYNWVHEEFTPCSASCGGGLQTRNVTCRSREELEIVDEGLCELEMMPRNNQTCNTDKCALEWSLGPWGKCSKRCGKGGTKAREVHCSQIITNGYPSIVDDKLCASQLGSKPDLHEACNEKTTCPLWFTGPWKTCDKLCDEGKQKRKVECYRKNGRHIEVLGDQECEYEKPADEQPCMLQPCDGVDWVLSDWSVCDNCLSTVRSRTAFCATKDSKVVNDSFCAYHNLPELQQPCNMTELPPCEVQWFSTPWSKCSAACGKGVQARKVFCGAFDGDLILKVSNNHCDELAKLSDTKECEIPKEECPSQWFAGPWSACTGEYYGEQYRYTMCLRGGEPADDCDPDVILFSRQSCKTSPCGKDKPQPGDVSSTPANDDEDYVEQEEENPEEGIKNKCKPRSCVQSEFGCCSDKRRSALGPFDEGCPKPHTCKESLYGCCPDGTSPAQGERKEGCPTEPCEETLFGCCEPDNKTTAEGNEQEGCPLPPDTEATQATEATDVGV